MPRVSYAPLVLLPAFWFLGGSSNRLCRRWQECFVHGQYIEPFPVDLHESSRFSLARTVRGPSSELLDDTQGIDSESQNELPDVFGAIVVPTMLLAADPATVRPV